MIIVVGAGIAGIACARELGRHGRDVVVLDRGRRIGGRLAIRRYDGRPVDIGGSYFTVSADAAATGFDAVVESWRTRGLARPWTDTFEAWSPDGRRRSQGPMRWAAPLGLRSLVEDLAADPALRVESAVTVERVSLAQHRLEVDGRPAEAVVLAMPDPQARRLLDESLAAEAAALSAEFNPVLALTAIWPERRWPDVSGIFVNDDPVLSWVADDGSRRGDRAPVLVAHSTPSFAGQHLERPTEGEAPMLDHLRQIVPGLDDEPSRTAVQRWTFAKPAEPRDRPFLLTRSGLGACGDGWATKSSVEAAFASGVRLARELSAR